MVLLSHWSHDPASVRKQPWQPPQRGVRRVCVGNAGCVPDLHPALTLAPHRRLDYALLFYGSPGWPCVQCCSMGPQGGPVCAVVLLVPRVSLATGRDLLSNKSCTVCIAQPTI
jgi:hypothetical protein